MTKKYVIDEEDVKRIILDAKKYSVDSIVWDFLKSKQEVELLAEGKVSIEKDLTIQNRIWDIGIIENHKVKSMFDLLKVYEGKQVKFYIEKGEEMKFIKLTDASNGHKDEPIFLNIDNSIGIKGGGCSIVYFDTCNFIVKETPEQILQLVKDGEI